MQVLGDAERKVLSAVCDTVVPSIERAPDPDGFWGRSATDMGIHLGVEDRTPKRPLRESRDDLPCTVQSRCVTEFGGTEQDGPMRFGKLLIR